MDTPPPVLPPAPAYKDRRTGLIVFGIFVILLGLFCLLMVPLSVVGQIMAAKRTGAELDWMFILPTLLIFALMAVSLVWLGVGSIQARRWARALLLCLGGMGLCIGLITLVCVVPVLGSMDEMMRRQGQEVPPGALAVAKVFAFGSILVIYVLIPGALVLFYRSRHVKLTCEARDPVARWTDRCPLPVLAMCILQMFGAVYLLALPRFGAAMPLAGFLVTGWAARVLWLGFAGLSFYGAWGFYHLRARVWLIYTATIVLFAVSSVVTFLRVDLLDYYRLVGMPEQQIEQIAASPLIKGHGFILMSVASLVIFGGYLLYLRRYFVTREVPGGNPAVG
jgi:hypothetical protein